MLLASFSCFPPTSIPQYLPLTKNLLSSYQLNVRCSSTCHLLSLLAPPSYSANGNSRNSKKQAWIRLESADGGISSLWNAKD